MLLPFTKMHGLGNDFVVINNYHNIYHLTKPQIIFLCDRHFGVGCDQLLFIEQSKLEHVDFKYRIFNANGQEVEQCGNGARCFALYVHKNKLCHKSEITVETLAGVIYLYLEEDSDQIRVNMGMPDFLPQNIPFLADELAVNSQNAIKDNNYLVELKDKSNILTKKLSFAAVSMGNPHISLVVDELKSYDVVQIGSLLSKQHLFPNGVNVGFMQIIDKNNIKLRVYERGAGETLACGSGACAAVVNGIQKGILKHHVRVQLPAGDLLIKWSGHTKENVWMSGPASFVFEGQIEI